MNDLIEMNKTMTSSQLSEMLGKEKKHINESIRCMFAQKIDGRIVRPSLDSRGYVSEYHLPELESKMFVAKHDINYLEKITQYWIDKTDSTKMTVIERAEKNAELALEHVRILKVNAQLEIDKTELAITLDKENEWSSIKRQEKEHGQKYSWRELTNWGNLNGYERKDVFDQNYGTVKSYHKDVWQNVYGVKIR